MPSIMYITINKGARDGIREDMGVIDGNGVVGIVYKTSPNYSVVISILNSKSSISCKIVGSQYLWIFEMGTWRFSICLSEGSASPCGV